MTRSLRLGHVERGVELLPRRTFFARCIMDG